MSSRFGDVRAIGWALVATASLSAPAWGQSTTYYPGETSVSLLAYEDQWPDSTDYDYNDVVVSVHWRLDRDTSRAPMTHGHPVVRARLTVDPVALGGHYSNGLGLQLPVGPAGAAGLVVQRRRYDADSPPAADAGWEDVSLAAGDSAPTVVLSSDLRELFGGTQGRLNVGVAGQAALVGQRLEVQFDWPAGADLDVAQAPFDLFIFRAGTASPRHEIHFPSYAGTSAMVGFDFPTNNVIGRMFINDRGIPAALNLKTAERYPTEATRVEVVFPEIVAFAALPSFDAWSGTGPDPRSFYARPSSAEGSVARPTPAARPTLAPVTREACTDGLEPGRGGSRVRPGAACVDAGCASGFHAEGGGCMPNVRACTPANGPSAGGTETWSGAWGPCVATACHGGYYVSAGACLPLTYTWSSTAFGECGGGAATYTYGSFGSCAGGTGARRYSPYGPCSASAVCGGSGVRTRSSTGCDFDVNSGTATRTASCGWVGSSGTRTRAVTCRDNLGAEVADAFCPGGRPATQESCTPTGLPICGGSPVTTQACTPIDVSVCGPETDLTSVCASPAGSEACAIANGSGSRSCAAGSTTWSACVPSSCNPGFHVSGSACLPNTTGLSTGAGTLAVSRAVGGGAGACTSLTVTNQSGGPVSLSVSFTGSGASRFETCTPSSGACGASLAHNAACALGVRAKGDVFGNFVATAVVSGTIIGATAASLTAQRAVTADVCGAIGPADECYWLVASSLDWASASASCAAAFGRLVTVNSSAEQSVLISWLQSRGVQFAWIGLNDRATEGAFEWDSALAPSYTGWAPWEPNGFSSENCVHLTASGWNDANCMGTSPAICERPAALACDGTVSGLAGETYWLTSAAPWRAAETSCQLCRGNLVTINGAGELNLLGAAFASTLPDTPWIGLNDLAVEGTFVWSSGAALTLSNWTPGEPNNAGGNEDCAHLNPNGTWNDANCAASRPGICER
jgi:LruC domain-containing protein